MIIINGLNNNLKNEVENLASHADKIDIATAFFTESDVINKWSEQDIKVNLLVSLRPPTNYYSLKQLQTAKNVEINFLGDEFHSKFILFYKKEKVFGAILGSSNFTSGGLMNNIETNIFIENKVTIKNLKSHFKQLIDDSNLLQPTDLDRFKNVYLNWLERQKQEKVELEKLNKETTKDRKKRSEKPYIIKVARQYFEYWRVVDEIRDLIKDIAVEEYPNIPTYLLLDHFWHYIKIHWHKETQLTLSKSNQKEIIPQLFKDYIKWDRTLEDGGNFSMEMNRRSKDIFQIYLSKDNIDKLTESQAREVYGAMHSPRMPIQRFGADDLFIELNGMPQIQKSLNYLIHSNDEMDLKIHNMVKDPEYKLKRFGTSAIQELNGWTKPETYPIRNDKADDAIKILGYEFS